MNTGRLGALGTRLRRSWLPLLLVGGFGAAISYAALHFTLGLDDARVLSTLQLRAEQQAQAFARKISRAGDDLQALAAQVAMQRQVDPVAFRRFAELLHHSDDSYSSVIWAPLVKASDRAAFVAAARKEFGPGFDIVERAPDDRLIPARGRAFYLPIIAAASFDPRTGKIGIDLAARPERLSTIEAAENTGRPSATPPTPIFTPQNRTLGFLEFWPVYATGTVPATEAERRRALRGFVTGVFSFDRMLPALLAGTPGITEAFDISIARNPEGPPVHVASYDPTTRRFAFGAAPSAVAPGGVTVHSDFDVFGRRWILQSHFSAAQVASLRSWGPWGRFAFALGLTVLLMVVVERERWRRFGVEAQVSERTAALTSANDALAREVEERRHMQEREERSQALIAATLQAAPFATVVMDTDFKVLLWNRAAEQIFGYAAAEVVGRPNPLFAARGDGALNALKKRILAGEVIQGLAQERTRKDGTVVQLRLSGAPIELDGKVTAFVGMLEDVTERNAIESQLAQAQKMEAIGNLTGGLAHDFNNLLGIIVGNLDLLRPMLKPDSDESELTGEALEAALRGADLTQRLLAFARRQPLNPRPVDLNALVTETVKLLSRTLGEAVEITLDLAPEIWRTAVDPVQLESALVNLSTNARDAMPRGGSLTITTRNRELDADYCATHADVVPGHYAMIEVTDSGTGMPREVMSRIFEPFYTTKEHGKGTGLGLSMVFGFMKQSGGHISVYSEPGAGTTFRLYLPRNGGAASAAAPDGEPAPAGRGERVLVVEDNEGLRRVVMRQLVELGYRPLEAGDAAAALAILEAEHEKVDLLFTDVVMPGGMDGFDLAHQVVARWPAIKVVLTSGFSGARIAETRGAAASVARLLSKPYRKTDLARALRDALDRGEKIKF